MQQFVAFAVASAVLFTAGLIAGQGVDRSDETVSPLVTVSSPTTATDVAPEDSAAITEQETPDEPLAKPMPSPIMNASHQQQEEVTDHYFFSSVDGTANSTNSSQSSTDQTTETSTAQITVENPEARRQLESLILRMFPDAAAETVAAWADAYSDMDLGEVEFILEQKRSLSGSLDSEIATAMLGTPLGATTAESLLSPQAMSPIVEAQNAVRVNLQSAWSSGYRRTVVIPEAVSNQSIPGSIALTPRQVTMFRSFETGRLQPSPVPTHVAIASKNGALMFCLDGNLFTRRGDFQRMADGRLGLVTSSGSYALKDSTPIPESVTSLEITTSGEIMYEAEGQPVSAGHVGIVELQELNRLQTVDGVFFTSETLNASSVPAANAELTTYQLEMSNVNRTDDTQLLELLNTELP
jgi:hypothetical protein